MTSSGLSWETAVENQAFILSPPSKSISLQTCEVKPKAASYPMITQKWFRQDQWQKFPSHAKLTYSVAFLPHRNENLKIWNFSQNTFNRKRKKKKKQYQDVLFKLLLSFYICQSSCHPTLKEFLDSLALWDWPATAVPSCTITLQVVVSDVVVI